MSDYSDSRYNTQLGIYKPGCGLRNVDMSWGHDEYVYQMTKDYLPRAGPVHAALSLLSMPGTGRGV